MNYFFTKEAYQLYLEIPNDLLANFWRFFIEENFIFEGELIRFFMIELWFWKNKLHHNTKRQFRCVRLLHEIMDNNGVIYMERLYNHPTTIFYKGKEIKFDYDIEIAEYVFGKYEEYKEENKNFDRDRTFADLWWNYHDTVLQPKLIFVTTKMHASHATSKARTSLRS